MRFERPHRGLADSYRSLVREFRDAGEALIPFPLSFDHGDFDAFLARLERATRGDNIPAGFVPNSTFWLVDGDGDVVGVSNLRHELNDPLRVEGGHIGYGVRPSARRRGHATELLRHTLGEARVLGIEKALLTCSKGNAGSAGTIIGCGGKLDAEEFIAARNEVVQRYWIAIP